MAISKAFAVGAGDSASGTTQTTATFNSTGYTHLVVFTKYEGASTTVTPSDNKSSTGWTSLTSQANRANDSRGQFHWVKIGTPGTGHTVTITLGAARSFRSVVVWLINATGGNIAVDAQTTAASPSDGTAIDAGSLATSGASVVSFMGVAEYNAVVYTAGSGWTEDYDPNGPNYTYGQSRGAETTTPIDPVCTGNTAQDWAACAVSFKESAGGGGGGATYETQPNPRRNRPGRGPYSWGRYYRAVFIGNTRTPQTYNVTLSESVSASDGVSATLTTAPSLSESTAVADAVSAVLAAVGALAEAASAADSINSAGSTFGASLAETAAASDALTSVLLAVGSLSESVTAQDQIAAGNATYSVSIDEAASVADQVAALVTFVASLTESVTAQDQVAAGAATYNVSLTETVSLGDLVASALIAAGGLSESVSATDAVSAGGPQTYNVSIVEAATAGDAVSATGTFGATLAEVVTLLDSLSAAGALTDAPASRTIVISGPSRVVIVQSGGRATIFRN